MLGKKSEVNISLSLQIFYHKLFIAGPTEMDSISMISTFVVQPNLDRGFLDWCSFKFVSNSIQICASLLKLEISALDISSKTTAGRSWP